MLAGDWGIGLMDTPLNPAARAIPLRSVSV